MTHHTYHDVYDGDGGQMQTRDEVMGIFGGQRVSHTNRDDVISHIAACVTHGYLTDEQAAARMDAAGEARTDSDLAHITRDLPGEEKLAALRARKRLSARAGGRVGRLSNWLLTTRLGRAVFHGSIAAFALMVAFVPLTVLTALAPHGRTGALGGAMITVTVILGVILTAGNLLWGVTWWADKR